MHAHNLRAGLPEVPCIGVPGVGGGRCFGCPDMALELVRVCFSGCPDMDIFGPASQGLAADCDPPRPPPAPPLDRRARPTTSALGLATTFLPPHLHRDRPWAPGLHAAVRQAARLRDDVAHRADGALLHFDVLILRRTRRRRTPFGCAQARAQRRHGTAGCMRGVGAYGGGGRPGRAAWG